METVIMGCPKLTTQNGCRQKINKNHNLCIIKQNNSNNQTIMLLPKLWIRTSLIVCYGMVGSCGPKHERLGRTKAQVRLSTSATATANICKSRPHAVDKSRHRRSYSYSTTHAWFDLNKSTMLAGWRHLTWGKKTRTRLTIQAT